MGIEGWSKKPKTVQEAAILGNTEFLQEAGRRGAEKRINNKDLRDSADVAWEEIKEERKRIEDEELRKSTNEHIIDSDNNYVGE